jgi:hypothetical protein
MTQPTANHEASLGSLVRLRVLNPSALPSHPILSAQQTPDPDQHNTPTLKQFISQALTEGAHFIDTTIPATFTPTKVSASPPSEARVHSSKGKISKQDLLDKVEGGKAVDHEWSDEFWFARRSVHTPGMEVGTAPWTEFVNGLLRDHSVHEADYTPNVYDGREVCTWETELKDLVLEGYEEVRMCSEYLPSWERTRSIEG